MNSCAIVATYHKTGTAWMAATFRQICEEANIPMVSLEERQSFAPQDCVRPLVVRSTHSKFHKFRWLFDDAQNRIFHLIRDPRDVVISGMHYHRSSDEPWLHVSHPEWGGSTYQEKLNTLDCERSRLLFEMNHSAKATIDSMLAWDYRRPNSFECKYEDLIGDFDSALFTQVARHLGFSEDELPICRDAFWKNSIFGQKSSLVGKRLHVRSGGGQQWKGVFDRALARAFVARFGDGLIRLGYERDQAWIDELPEVSEKLDAPEVREPASVDPKFMAYSDFW